MKRYCGSSGHLFFGLLLVAATKLSSPLSAQMEAPLSASEPYAGASFAGEPYRTMEALLEVSIFRIDVLQLTVGVGPDTWERLDTVVHGHADYSEALADSVARVMLEARDAWARQVFLRDVSLKRLAGAMHETAVKAADAGYVSQEYASSLAETLPQWFGFLEERGAKKGDAIHIRIRGDEVRTTYRTVDGQVLLDDVGVDPEGRRAGIPSFYAPDARFRRRLVESLLAKP